MSYLRNVVTNAVTADLDTNGVVYQTLTKQRTTADQTITPDSSVKGNEAPGSLTLRAGSPIWEDMPEERAELHATRVLAAVLDPAGAAVDTRTTLSRGLERDIVITAAEYQPSAAIKGAATNFRTISIIAGDELASPVTAAKLAFEAGTNAGENVETALTLEEAAKLKVKAGINVVADSKHSGTGIADPGGIVLVTYTHD